MYFIIFLIILIIVLILGYFFIFKKNKRKNLLKTLKYKLLLISIYNPIAEEKIEWRSEIKKSEQFFESLADFSNPPVMEIAVKNSGEEIYFYLAVSEEEVEKAIQLVLSFWQNSEVQLVEDYNIFNPQGSSLIGKIGFTKDNVLPIKIYENLSTDVLLAIIQVFSSLKKEGEGIAYQVIFRKASSDVLKSYKNVISEIQKGASLKEALKKSSSNPVLLMLEGFSEVFSSKKENKDSKPKEIDSKAIEFINSKISKPLFETNLRIVVSAGDLEKAKKIFSQISASVAQVNEPLANSLKLSILKGKQEKMGFYDFSFRRFKNKDKIILNSSELSTLIHFPTREILEIPKVKMLKAKSAFPPIELPSTGITLGKSFYHGIEKEIKMATEDRFRHMYIIGQTGTGKSTFMKNLIKQDIENGNGLAFFDPHGDDAFNILSYVPDERIEDVVYFNPSDINHPIGFNILEYDKTKLEQATLIVNELLEIIGKIYNLAEVGGPVFEQYFKNALFLLLKDPILTPTILDVPRVFADSNFRKTLLSRSPDSLVVNFWQEEAEKAGGDFSLSNITPWITSKLNPFISNDFIKPIVGQEHSSLNLDEIIKEGRILIINLSKSIGETNAYFLGMMLVSKLFISAISREAANRKDFYLYIDEFQNITTKTIVSILSEARKFRLSLTIAHQYIKQIDESIRDAIFGNVGTMLAFRVSINDAEFLKEYFKPVFNDYDLINIENFNAYLRLLVNGKVAEPFNIKIDYPAKVDFERAKKVEQFSRLKYGGNLGEILQNINDQYNF